MAVDKNKIKEHIRGILEAIGEDPYREGLIDTPSRVANMYEEMFCAVTYSNSDIAKMFDKTFEEDFILSQGTHEIVMVKDIEIFSMCEHHLALMYNMKVAVAYIPNKKILGLSKIARIADMVSKKPQLQERIGSDIAEIMKMVSGTEDVAVIIEGQHACMTSRGIKNGRSVTKSITLSGRFDTDSAISNKFMMLYGKQD
jgi:GTP cyclohydrolase I